jgi:hypothetical protein
VAIQVALLTRALSREASRATAPLGVLAFWGGLWMAEKRYPSEYDWRYMTISSLVYPDRNPGGYLWAWGGIILCGLGGLCWVAVQVWNREQENARGQPTGTWALGLGYICMVCCALLPVWVVHIRKSHDLLALLAFVGVCIGTVQLTFQAVDRRLRSRALSFPGSPRVYAWVLAGAPLLPILLVGAAQAYVSHALPQLPWVGLEWRALGVPMYLSFAFWEWVTCVVLSAYTTSLAFLAFGCIPKPNFEARTNNLPA